MLLIRVNGIFIMSSRWVDEFRYNRYRPQILDTLPNFQGEQKNHEFRFASEKGPWVGC